jgi:hypothetical protein
MSKMEGSTMDDREPVYDEVVIEIKRVEGNELHCRYPGQNQVQDCHVELDAEHGKLSASYNPEIGTAVPMRVWHGHVVRWLIPALKAEPANALLDEIAPLAKRVCDGYESRWDGHNHVARFDADARSACEEIERLCEAAGDDDEEQIRVWDAADWFEPFGGDVEQAHELGITAATTDEQLDEIQEREETTASENGCDEIEGAFEHLRRLRDHARDAGAEVE